MEEQQVESPVGHFDDLVIRKLPEAADYYNGAQHEEDGDNKISVVGEIAEQIPQEEHVSRAEAQKNGEDQFGFGAFGVQEHGFRQGEPQDNDGDLDQDYVSVVLLFFAGAVVRVLEEEFIEHRSEFTEFLEWTEFIRLLHAGMSSQSLAGAFIIP